MAFLQFNNVRIAGFSAGVPKTVVKPKSRNPKYSDEEFIKNVGCSEKRVDDQYATSDLCYVAAEQLISDLNWNKEDIDALIFVSQYRDYILPVTATILQEKLGLSKECYAADVPLGCSGWGYGLSVLAALMQNGNIKKALLLTGDARRMHPSALLDPLFGFAGCVTALEYQEDCAKILMHCGSDGSGYDAIIVPDGGARNRFNDDTFIVTEDEEGILRNGLCSKMKGMDVFSFAISTAPKSIKKLAEKHSLNLDEVDYLVLHQANKSINERIAKKSGFGPERVLNSMEFYGNTSSASIPMSIIAQTTTDTYKRDEKSFMTCGFGVGLSWATVYFKLKNCIISNLVEI